MLQWWRNLSVVKKLYAVVGIMAMLIAVELGTLYFTMRTMSAVRTFVGGEGLWSKSQKSAVQSIQRYVLTGDESDWVEFQNHLQVPLGDRQGRQEIEKDNHSLAIIIEGFTKGKIHPDDIPGLYTFILRFHNIPHVAEALQVWRQADTKLDDLISYANHIRNNIDSIRKNGSNIREVLDHINKIDTELTILEDRFSYVLGEGSRWAEHTLMMSLILIVLSIELTSLLVTVSFSRNLSRSLKELNQAAREIGQGQFDQKLPVRSNDELGQLANSLNQMSSNLKSNLDEKVRAESANQFKTIFLANMSHEIRTPLGVILGTTEVLKNSNLAEEERAQYLDMIHRTGNNLNQIINDILDISKVEAGHLSIQLQSFNLTEFLNDLESMLRIRANEADVKLTFNKRGPLPEWIKTDPHRLRQILVNLINNAIKFNNKGWAEVTFWATDSQLFIKISDSGIGMTPDEQQKIFSLFYQGNSKSHRSREGTGLGLVLSRHLAKALGGDVSLIDSQSGVGTTFLVQVNYEVAPAIKSLKKPLGLPMDILEGKKILVVEDNPDNQTLTRVFLTQKGVQVDFANNGQESIEKVQEKDYDMVLMDIQMPVMNGFEATKILRQRGFEKPIIALTAHALTDERIQILKAGCNACITKPFDSTTLLKTISSLL